MRFLPLPIALVLLLSGLAGCDNEGRTRPPATTVRVFNAAPSYEALNFLREQRIETNTDRGGPLPFGGGQLFSFDSDEYDFSVETILPGIANERHGTITRSVNDQNEYFIIVTDDAGEIDLRFLSRPVTAGETSLTIVHAAESQAAMDVYFEPADTDPASSTPLASVAFGGDEIVDTFAGGDVQLILTAAGDPASILLRSTAGTFAEGNSYLLVFVDERNFGTAPFGAFLMASGTQRLVDPSQNAVIRVINGASDMLSRDVYLDDDFTTPLVGDTAFAGLSAYVPITDGEVELSVTPAGNPGAVEVTGEPTILPGRRYTMTIGGNPSDELITSTVAEDHRSLIGAARLRFVNAAHEFPVLDFYIAAPGTDVLTINPAASVGPDGGFTNVTVAPGDYELTVRDRSNATIVAGPMPLSLPEGSVQLLLATDASGGSTADIQLFDDTGA